MGTRGDRPGPARKPRRTAAVDAVGVRLRPPGPWGRRIVAARRRGRCGGAPIPCLVLHECRLVPAWSHHRDRDGHLVGDRDERTPRRLRTDLDTIRSRRRSGSLTCFGARGDGGRANAGGALGVARLRPRWHIGGLDSDGPPSLCLGAPRGPNPRRHARDARRGADPRLVGRGGASAGRGSTGWAVRSGGRMDSSRARGRCCGWRHIAGEQLR